MSDPTSDVGNQQHRARHPQGADQPSGDTIDVAAEVGNTPEAGAVTDAWTIAALAHASIVLTLLFAFAGGIGALVGLAVPLVIYLSYRERSRFVAFHALQALVYQGAGVLIYLASVIVLALIVTVVWTITGLLSAVAIGFLFWPLALLVTVLMVLVLLLAPLAWVAYGLYTAYRVYQGEGVRYWLLGDWVEREAGV